MLLLAPLSLLLLSPTSAICMSPPAPPDILEVLSSLGPSLQGLLPSHLHLPLLALHPSAKLESHLQNLEAATQSESEMMLSELTVLAIQPGGLLGSGLLDLLEAIMAAIVRFLDHHRDLANMGLDLRVLFNMLCAPLVELAILTHPLPEYQYTTEVMDDKAAMRFIEETFDNWGATLLTNVTVRTYFPRTVVGIQNIVKMAGEQGARVRASGTR